MKRQLKFGLIVGLVLWCASVARTANAEESTVVRLNLTTVERGYTVWSPDRVVKLGLPPGALPAPTTVTVTESLEENLPAPEGYRFATPQYRYDIAQTSPALLANPVRLTFTDTGRSLWKQRIAFFNNRTQAWQMLPTRTSGESASTWIRFPYVRIVVLEEEGTFAVPGISSRSVAVLDDAQGTVLGGQNGGETRSIASLSKLMTALVFLDTNPDWARLISYQRSDERAGARLRVRIGDVFSVRDAFSVMLIGSANNATMAVVHSTGLSVPEFVRRMNAKAASLGLSHTHFVEPTGLNAQNVSTASEYALLAHEAFLHDDIVRVSEKQSYRFTTRNTKRTHTIKNTNELLFRNPSVLAGKTGYIDEAGYCLVVKTTPGGTGESTIIVVLGNATSSGRFRDMERLVALTETIRGKGVDPS